MVAASHYVFVFFGIIVTLLVKLLKTEEKVRTDHVIKN